MRNSIITRKTKETEIDVELNLDGTGNYNIDCEFKFFKHMIEQFVFHSGIDLKLTAKSLDGDEHHLVEDVALSIGKAFNEALSDKKGINRYGQCILPMDEALVLSAIDISGRSVSKVSFDIKEEKISDFSTILLVHFFNSFVQACPMAIHIKQLDGYDSHHIVEAAFKSFARSMKTAITINNDFVPSTKGLL